MENTKPWLDLKDNKVSQFYPASANAKNCYALFSPPLDRFLIVDNLDPWIMFEAAKIISSKIIVVCYILNDSEVSDMTNENCLLYGTVHKKGENTYGSSLMSSVKQPACMTHFNSEIIHLGWPSEFTTDARKEMVLKMQEYSLFVLRCLHAVTISDAYRNIFPESKYLHDYMSDSSPKDLQVCFDSTIAPTGMVNVIKSILYHSNSVDEALEEIRLAWEKYSKNDISGFREKFYDCLGIPMPEMAVSLKEIADNVTVWVI
jgi:hypothetical protein